MTNTLSAACLESPTPAANPSRRDGPDTLVEALARIGRRRDAAVEWTPALVRYWQELPHHSVDARHRLLEALRSRVKCGEIGVRVLVPIALADPDEDIVRAATTEYLRATPVSIERRQASLDEALDWIRRGLALNRVAVFLALLAIGDEAVNARLASLRLQLSAEETARVWQGMQFTASAPTASFLDEWRQVLATQ